jgi:hypothetical protein
VSPSRRRANAGFPFDCSKGRYTTHFKKSPIHNFRSYRLSWGFRSLLGAMYLQMAWRITSRRCEVPGCNNIIGLHERSNKKTCSLACKERRRYHRN